jgi:Tol biopolymer transport system component
MDEMTAFEQRFEERVRSFAQTGARAVDSAAVAHSVAVARRRDQGAGWSVRWHGLELDARVRTTAVALGLLAALLGGALLAGARLLNLPPPVTNGWIAFTVEQPATDGLDGDLDIWLVALHRDARRVVGSETDRVHQLCPAFSPDGRSLAYGRVQGNGTDYFMNPDGTEGARPARYRQAKLVVADVSDDGTLSDRLTIDVGDGLPPPCPIWSPDGGQVAFGVNRTSPINPEQSAAGSEVWVVILEDRDITVLPDLLATDLEWSPDGSHLAIASGVHAGESGNMLHDGRIELYAPASGAIRSLDGTLGAVNLTWSRDSRRIAWAGLTGGDDSSLELRGIDVETGQQEVFAAGYGAIHGIGPVWSPAGETIAFQRCRTNPCGGESHEVVLVTPPDPSDTGAIAKQVVIPSEATSSGSHASFYPWHVTWSPDSEYLLYMAWERGGDDSGPALVAVPADLDEPPVVVAQLKGIVPRDGYPDTTLVPIQAWGRTPSD